MNDTRDNGFSPPGSASQGVSPDPGQPRKPRIEVLQRSPAAAPEPGPAHGSDRPGTGAAGSPAPGAQLGQAAWVSPGGGAAACSVRAHRC
jgi:hypothetical protein